MKSEKIICKGLIYKFLSLMFSYPKKGRVRLILELYRDMKKFGCNKILNLDIGNIVEMLNRGNLEELQTEYVRIFEVAYPKTPCPPYESFYRINMLNDPMTIESLMAIYGKYGLKPEKESPDHISTMLEFLYFIHLNDNLKENERLEIERSFIKIHLWWMKRFLKCINVSARNAIYIELTKILEKFFKIKAGD